MDQNDWAADNVAFGMGGALLQKIDRDTQKMAIKCSYIEGETFDEARWQSGRPMLDEGAVKWHRDVFKQPKTDAGKNSKRGRLKLVKREDGFHTESAGLSDAKDELVEVFRDGEVLVHHTLPEVRERAAL
jgi:nicotinamide phosphoribosyltransferase